MNSVLQCLTHTPPLAEAVLSGRAQCPPSSSSDDPLAITLSHIHKVFSSHGIVRPSGHAKVLRIVNKRCVRLYVGALTFQSPAVACIACSSLTFIQLRTAWSVSNDPLGGFVMRGDQSVSVEYACCLIWPFIWPLCMIPLVHAPPGAEQGCVQAILAKALGLTDLGQQHCSIKHEVH
jgi:hypothetical protein